MSWFDWRCGKQRTDRHDCH